MNSQSTRIVKEARALFGAWCALTLAGLPTWLPHELRYVTSFLTFVSSMGFWVGVPLLATLALGMSSNIERCRFYSASRSTA